MDLARQKRDANKVRLPSSNAPPKFDPQPHPLLRLSRSALLPEATDEEVQRAAANFSCSVSRDTQRGYRTGARHYLAAQKCLGRSFSSPPSQTDLIYFTNYLLGKKIGIQTIRHYLSGVRFFLMSQGQPIPPKLPTLAEQLMTGREKAGIDAVAAAVKKTKRAVTVDMLKLLSHAIAIRESWSTFEKSLRWSVVLLAFWGLSGKLPKVCRKPNLGPYVS